MTVAVARVPSTTSIIYAGLSASVGVVVLKESRSVVVVRAETFEVNYSIVIRIHFMIGRRFRNLGQKIYFYLVYNIVYIISYTSTTSTFI